MPVGMPQVEYQLPGEPDPEFINIFNALYRERMLFLCQEIQDEVANELIGLMLFLNSDDPSRALFLYINSPGGSVTGGIGIYDIMRYLNSGITTICMGTASSMASFILAGGTYGRRIAMPNSRIMIHQPEGGSDGQATEIITESTEVARIRRQVGLIYANRTAQSVERIAQDLDRDQFLSAWQARAYGLVDYVAILDKEGIGVPTRYDLLGISPAEPTLPEMIRGLIKASAKRAKRLGLETIIDESEFTDEEEEIYDFNRESESFRLVPLPLLFSRAPASTDVGTTSRADLEGSDGEDDLPILSIDIPSSARLFPFHPEIYRPALRPYRSPRAERSHYLGQLDAALGCVEAIFGLEIDLEKRNFDLQRIKEYLRNPAFELTSLDKKRQLTAEYQNINELQSDDSELIGLTPSGQPTRGVDIDKVAALETKFTTNLQKKSIRLRQKALSQEAISRFPVPAADLARKLIFARRQRAAKPKGRAS